MEKYTILLVDDETDNLDFMYRTLRGKYKIFKTTSPIAALELMKDEDIDLVVSDHKMPEMEGTELLKFCSLHYPNTMRVLVTAFSDIDILVGAINNAQIHRYIKKPYSPDELLSVVVSSLEYLQLKKDNNNLAKDLKDLFSGTIKAIIEALDAKDSFTLGRSKRVSFFAMKVAEKLGLSPIQIGEIELAGLLHDIGMIGVSDKVLSKKTKLDISEYQEIKTHVQHGIAILEDIKQLGPVVDIIKYHHEHYDGLGYPYGISKDDIPIGSQIIAVADAYDSLTSNRSYRKGLKNEEALARIKDFSGTQFNPEIVNIFMEILPSALEQISDFENSF